MRRWYDKEENDEEAWFNDEVHDNGEGTREGLDQPEDLHQVDQEFDEEMGLFPGQSSSPRSKRRRTAARRTRTMTEMTPKPTTMAATAVWFRSSKTGMRATTTTTATTPKRMIMAAMAVWRRRRRSRAHSCRRTRRRSSTRDAKPPHNGVGAMMMFERERGACMRADGDRER